MSHETDERRRFQRIDFDAPTTIIQGHRRWQAALHDISLKGLLIETPLGWHGNPNQPFNIQIHLNAAIQVNMQALLTRIRTPYLGFTCQHIDLESISHLRRLLELNLADEALLERELGHLGESTEQ